MDIYDPWVSKDEAQYEYGVEVLTERPTAQYDAVIISVAHDEFKSMSVEEYRSLTKSNSVIYDLKYVLDAESSDIRL